MKLKISFLNPKFPGKLFRTQTCCWGNIYVMVNLNDFVIQSKKIAHNFQDLRDI